MANKIKVKFEAQGAKSLKLAIEQLAVAQTRLNKSNSAAEKLQKKLNRQVEEYNRLGIFGARNTRNLSFSLSVLRSKILIAAFGFTALNKTVGSTLRAFGEQELAEKKLEQALGRTSKGLLAQASALQRVTSFGDEAIISAQALIAAFVDDEEQIKAATAATLDLAAAKGMDLNSAADLVSKTLGSSTNSLSRYGIEVEGAVGSSERLNSLTKSIATTFGGQAKAQTDTYTGAMTQLSNIVGDISENLGAKLAPTIVRFAKGLSSLLTSQTPVTDAAIEQNQQFKILFQTFKNLNPESEARRRIINEINTEYPDYIKNLKLEEASLEQIAKFEKETNEQLLARIVIAMREEEIAAAKLKSEEAARKLVESQKELTEVTNKYNKSLKETGQGTMGYGAAAGFVSDKTSLLSARLNEVSNEVNKNSLEFKKADENLTNLMSTQTEEEIQASSLIARKISSNVLMKESNELIVEQIDLNKANITTFAELDKATEKAINREKKLNDALTLSSLSAMRNADQFESMGEAVMLTMFREAQAQAQLAISRAIASALIGVPFPGNIILAKTAGAAIGQLMPKLEKFEAGGMVGGRRHSQGGTMIEAEQGEFVMSRDAVESIGSGTLDAMNQGGGGAVTVNISGNVMTDDFVEGELAEKIATAVRRGTDFGMS
tara:strand:+ start:3828 stop:5819 length:1992 start_codon:yes stop_codon:yes gene_type:complete